MHTHSEPLFDTFVNFNMKIVRNAAHFSKRANRKWWRTSDGLSGAINQNGAIVAPIYVLLPARYCRDYLLSGNGIKVAAKNGERSTSARGLSPRFFVNLRFNPLNAQIVSSSQNAVSHVGTLIKQILIKNKEADVR